MSIRLRLALCYGALFALILPFVTGLSYAIHARGQYDDLDRTLIVSTEHAAVEAASSASGPHLAQGEKGFEIALRLYSPNGLLQDQTLGTASLPSIDPRLILRTPTGPAFDTMARLFPPLLGTAAVTPDRGSAFGLMSTPQQRWRVYVLPFHAGQRAGYLEAVTPLGRLDDSIQIFRLTLPLVGLVSLLVALLGSWAIAGNALRPVTQMIQAAQTITFSRDLSRRIAAPMHHDELGRLAATFNEMLVSINTAHQTQQRFVADASHELRAPLTAIQGNIELLRRKPEMPDIDRAEALIELEREAARLSRLVADLLILARADAGIALKHCPLDLDLLVLDAFRETRYLAHGQTLQLAPFEPVQIEGDEDRLKQLLLILLDNALKYTPVGDQVTLGLCRHGCEVDMLVRDTGIGIEPEVLPHVFERFYRADPARSRDPGGTGLGLSIAQWIVEQHAGKIWLESQPRQGTLVTVRLPLRDHSSH
ncbi:sensor histidine kinase [Dictyobacter aurantiacus]|uniref:histidine kinase n=1 Tax=Dictyobacter aurantiacus TaxID=1936993 RepID=A0A401Z9A0_9CHLR|nr:HAMP domain-containing sensor histidine kinase [Dictyobacter aurantiacus]GCE03425.1 two-component sensor histidine kinase [Dictyobacter aurantiacus]